MFSCTSLFSLIGSAEVVPNTDDQSLFTIPGDVSVAIFLCLLIGAGVLGMRVFTAGLGKSLGPSILISVSSVTFDKLSSSS